MRKLSLILACALLSMLTGCSDQPQTAAKKEPPKPAELFEPPPEAKKEEPPHPRRAGHRTNRALQDVPGGPVLGARRSGAEDEQHPSPRSSLGPRRGGRLGSHVYVRQQGTRADLHLFRGRVARQLAPGCFRGTAGGP